ncbi:MULTISPECIES: hypothetical protein [Cysteiniphilum]|uniref:hypothetical protein n=1 Tax=Cysteiniphilum TaxID=2056696 RepID=UPI0017812580|nr:MULTISPECIES: hypothetical protein [Cysteiniphilum]
MKYHRINLIIFCLLLSGCKGNNSSNSGIELPKPVNGQIEAKIVSDGIKDNSDKGKSPVVTQPVLQTIDSEKAYSLNKLNKNIYIYEHSYKAHDDASDHRLSYEYIVEDKQAQNEPTVTIADKRLINNLDHRLGLGKNDLGYARNYVNTTKKAQVRDREVATELVTMKNVAISNTPDKFIINRENYHIHSPIKVIKVDKNQMTDYKANKIDKDTNASPIYADKQQQCFSSFDYSYRHDVLEKKPLNYAYSFEVSVPRTPSRILF